MSGPYRSGGPRPRRRQRCPSSAGRCSSRRRGAGARGTPTPSRGTAPDARAEDDALADTVLDVIVRRLEGQGAPAHQVWLPPLDRAPVAGPAAAGRCPATPGRGLHRGRVRAPGRLVVPLGLVDKPFEQRRDALYRDFSGAAGHMHDRRRPAVRQVDAAAHADRVVRAHPHPARGAVLRPGLRRRRHGVAGRTCRTWAGSPRGWTPSGCAARSPRWPASSTRREEFFRAHGIDSIATYRRRRAARRTARTSPGATSSWSSTAGATSDGLRGAGAGRPRHRRRAASATASTWCSRPPAPWRSGPPSRTSCSDRLELRLGDAMDSEFDRKVAANVPAGRTRAAARSRRSCTSWRRCRGSTAHAPAATSSEATARPGRGRSARHWQGPAAPGGPAAAAQAPRRPAAARASSSRSAGIAIGIDEDKPRAGLRRLRAPIRSSSSSARASPASPTCCG